MHELLIRNGTVVDGSGKPGVRADVAVDGGTIVAVGDIDGGGKVEIDADGLVVTPGFIDLHTHLDAQVLWDPLGEPSAANGVTTVVMGNCGYSLAPSTEDARDLIARTISRAEDIDPTVLAELPWTWRSFRDYLAAVDGATKSMNFAAGIGHSALRATVMGERCFTEAAGDDDLRAMEAELRDALAAGATSFSTSRSTDHETTRNEPVPSRAATWAELRRLAAVMRGTGAVLQIEGDSQRKGDPEWRAENAAGLRSVAVEDGVPTTFSVITNSVTPDPVAQLDLIDETVGAGGRMFGVTTCRPIGVHLSFKARLPFDGLPVWRDVRAEPLERQLQLLADTGVRAKLVAAANNERGYGRALAAEIARPRYDLLQVLRSALPPNPTVAALAQEQGVDPVEVMIDLAVASRFEQLFVQPLANIDQDQVLRILHHPHVVMTLSDSGAHLTQVADACIQVYLLAHWVRHREAFELEEAVRMVTGDPADAWGFRDRGYVRPGLNADLNVIDPATVGPGLPTLVHDLPGGSARLKHRATGIAATIVNGAVVYRDGAHTGAFPGRLVRRTAP